jgi:hypothetical protein
MVTGEIYTSEIMTVVTVALTTSTNYNSSNKCNNRDTKTAVINATIVTADTKVYCD